MLGNENKQHAYERLKPENALELKKRLQSLLEKDWRVSLTAIGLTGGELRNGQALMHAFACGFVATIHDQLKRYLLPKNYILPNFFITQPYGFDVPALFDREQKVVWINETFIKSHVRSAIGKVQPWYYQGVVLKFVGTLSDLMQHYGIEEAKHSVDYFAGKVLRCPATAVGANPFAYHKQRHEITALGEQVLLTGKRDKNSLEHQTTKSFLQQVIRY